jgi:hypothetical protein
MTGARLDISTGELSSLPPPQEETSTITHK